jgi:hypothetical protein
MVFFTQPIAYFFRFSYFSIYLLKKIPNMKNQYLIFLFLFFAGSAKTQSVEHNLPTLYESQLDALVPMPDSNYLATLYESQQILSVCKFSKKGELLWRKKIIDQYSSVPIYHIDTYFDVAQGQIYLLFQVFNCDITSIIGYRMDLNGENIAKLNSDDATIRASFKEALGNGKYIAMLQQGQKDTFLLPQYKNTKGFTEINLAQNKKISTLTTIQGDYSRDIGTLSSDKIILYSKTENKVKVLDLL